MTRRSTNFFRRDEAGVSAVEFAILLPILITLMFGGFAVTKTVAISRKVTITTRALADLTSQYPTMSASDMTNVMNASTQILAPFDATPLGMRITEVTMDLTGLIATVTWSKALGPGVSCNTPGSLFPWPLNMPRSPNESFIYAETFYSYAPPFGASVVGPISLGDRIFMLPRTSANVAYTGSSQCAPT